jgi:probable HAF family extracellular repeat protein
VRYAITDVGSLDPVNNGTTNALAINDLGAVVGFGQSPPYHCGSYVCVDSHAFVARGDTIVDLGLVGDAGPCSANSINDSNQVVGSAMSGGLGNSSAVLWDNGSRITLPDFGGSAWAFAIDESGRIVGAAVDAHGEQRPVAWRNGVLFDLGTLRGGTAGYAGDINASGIVVGGSEDAQGVTQPVAWVNGRIRELGILDPTVAWGEALAVNDSGQAVGASSYWNDLYGGVQIAVLWSGGTVHNLGALNDLMSRAYDINEQGQVVGQSDVISSGDGRAFLWSDGVMYDLNDAIDPQLGWKLYSARGISDDGRIVGIGACPCGGEHGFLLTPLD